MSKVIERLLEYVKIDTQSDGASKTTPSSQKQHHLAKLLTKELEEMGAQEITYDEEHCYVYATVPASEGCENTPVLGFISHMDTASPVSGANVKPRVVENYDGGDILLNKEKNIWMKAEEFPNLAKHKGKDLIVTDGTTLLGADDKAGVAEIMSMAEYFLSHPECKHGKIRVGFTPDEEIGRGPDHFDVALFGADIAYTVDGGPIGELEYENFNAASAELKVYGRSVHPGSAKNAILIAMEFQNMLPEFQNPMYTEGYEGFFYLDSITGDVEETTSEYIIRDHDRTLFEQKKQLFEKTAEYLNFKYGAGTVETKVEDSYYNMKEVIEPHMYLIDNAKKCMEELGITPVVSPIRGGTDGARLSFMGLPCPNLCTGGENFHGRYEFACVQSIEKIVELLVRIAESYVK